MATTITKHGVGRYHAGFNVPRAVIDSVGERDKFSMHLEKGIADYSIELVGDYKLDNFIPKPKRTRFVFIAEVVTGILIPTVCAHEPIMLINWAHKHGIKGATIYAYVGGWTDAFDSFGIKREQFLDWNDATNERERVMEAAVSIIED